MKWSANKEKCLSKCILAVIAYFILRTVKKKDKACYLAGSRLSIMSDFLTKSTVHTSYTCTGQHSSSISNIYTNFFLVTYSLRILMHNGQLLCRLRSCVA